MKNRIIFLTFSLIVVFSFSLQAQINLDVEGDGIISGDLGIGTTSPLVGLHLSGSKTFRIDGITTYTNFRSYNSGDGSGSVILQIDPTPTSNDKTSTIRLFRSVNAESVALAIMKGNNSTQSNHVLRGSSDSYMSLTGNLGIGITSPESKLTVYDNQPNAFTIQTPDNSSKIGLAFQNSGGNYSWNIFRNPNTTNSGNAALVFAGGISNASIDNLQEHMRITSSGNVAIGTSDPLGYKFVVKGNIGAEEIEVRTNYWADIVFKEGYDLRTLQEVEEFINANGHLPDVPSEAEAINQPLNLGAMDVLLLQKVEELTLYTIEQDKTIKRQQELIEQQAQLLQSMEKRLQKLEEKE